MIDKIEETTGAEIKYGHRKCRPVKCPVEEQTTAYNYAVVF